MPITTSVSSSTRKPGTFQEFDVTSAARGLVPITRRVALVGAKLAAGTKANQTPTQLFTEADGDTFFGAGSEVALMNRAAIKAGKKYGNTPQIWGCSLADPAGTAATRTFTITGPATASGDLVIKICGRTIVLGIANGAAQNTIATNLDAAIDAVAGQLPITSAAATNVVTLTARNTGPNGNDIKIAVVSAPAGVTCTAADVVSGATAYDITTTLDVLIDKHYHAIAVAGHTSTIIDDLQTHIDARGLPGVKQWVFGYVAETGTLSTATTLASGGNQKEVVVVSAEDFPNMPGEIAAQAATTVEAESDVARSFDGVELDLFLPPAASVPTDSEIETAIAGGVTILTVNDEQDQAKIVRLVTTKTTEASVAFENLLDISNPRTLFFVAEQVDIKWKQMFQRAKKNARTIKRVKSVTMDVLRQAEALELLQNVEAHAGELVVETDPVVKTRLNVEIPQSIIPNLHQIVGKHVLYVE